SVLGNTMLSARGQKWLDGNLFASPNRDFSEDNRNCTHENLLSLHPSTFAPLTDLILCCTSLYNTSRKADDVIALLQCLCRCVLNPPRGNESNYFCIAAFLWTVGHNAVTF
ncbi:hypothetical protein Tco_1088169, partial [Tanacetum coccineum]